MVRRLFEAVGLQLGWRASSTVCLSVVYADKTVMSSPFKYTIPHRSRKVLDRHQCSHRALSAFLVQPIDSPSYRFPTQVAILAATFSSQTPNGRTAYSGGLDKRLREWDFETGQNRVLGKADDALSTVTACGESGIVVTGSWDSKLRVWDP